MGKYELVVDERCDDDEDGVYRVIGTFATYADAEAAVKDMVDDYLDGTDHTGMTSAQLFKYFTLYGDDPAILCDSLSPQTQENAKSLQAAFNVQLRPYDEATGGEGWKEFNLPTCEAHFLAWEYAAARCKELCTYEDSVSTVLRYPALPQELALFSVVLNACLCRSCLSVDERQSIEAILTLIAGYPRPSSFSDCSLVLLQGYTFFCFALYPNRYEFSACTPPYNTDWEVYFKGSGLRDRRHGDASAALDTMRLAALDTEYMLYVSAR